MRGRHRQRDALPSEKRRKQKLTSPAPKLQQAKRKKTKKQKREEKEATEILRRRRALILAGKLVPVNRAKWHSYGRLLFISPPDDSKTPFHYEDLPFTCKDCGKQEIWTARQQKWWYEEIGGSIERTAARCAPCRAKERARKAEVNRLRIEGMERKRQRLLKRPWG